MDEHIYFSDINDYQDRKTHHVIGLTTVSNRHPMQI